MARVLVINDDSQAVAVREALAAAGHEVHTELSQAVGSGEAQSVALVILHVLLPGKDRLHILRDLRRRFSNVPIITLTGRVPSEQDARLLQQLGATRVLEHPSQPTALLAVVAAMLRQGIS
jgi:DNA-binding response OmpR family regulator